MFCSVENKFLEVRNGLSLKIAKSKFPIHLRFEIQVLIPISIFLKQKTL
jgi:hypothetical protein